MILPHAPPVSGDGLTDLGRCSPPTCSTPPVAVWRTWSSAACWYPACFPPPLLAHALQKYMNRAMGPILILVGLVLLEAITFNLPGSSLGDRLQKKAETMGVWGAGLLGILFALSFCPTSAALFFGSLLPLSLHQGSGVMLPGVYGIATGLPVLLFAVLIALGANKVGQAFNRIQMFERWARRITGAPFIVIGGYYCLATVWGFSL